MGWLDRARAVFRSPADRRLEQAAAAAFAKAPRPVHPGGAAMSIRADGGGNGGPGYGGSLVPPSNPRDIDWFQDQPLPPPQHYSFRPGYSDHLFQQFSTPVAFENFMLARVRAAVAVHRLGYFYESWALSVNVLGFAPILAALQQAVAPILSLKRHVHGGDKGLARMVADEVSEQVNPSSGLEPSPYIPPALWGTMAIYIRMLGFCVLQHVDGDPDPETGVRPRYTRIWEPWATRCNPSPLKWLAITTEGEIEIRNDGKFTLVADELRPHLSGAIVAIGEESLAGKLTMDARNAWIDANGQVKWIATLPEKIATHGEAGAAFLEAVAGIAGPGGLGVFPFGSEFKSVALTRDTSGAFGDTLGSVIAHIGMVLLGSPGPIISGVEGVYQAKNGLPVSVRQDLIDRPTIAMVRALNQGHIAPYCDQNYGEAIERAKRAGVWKYPVLEIPLDDPDLDARIASVIGREKARCEILDMRKASGVVVAQEDADALAEVLAVGKVVLATTAATPAARLDLAPTDLAKVVTVDEARASRQLPPIGGERGKMTIAELEAATKSEPFGGAAAEQPADASPPPDASTPPTNETPAP